MSVCQHVIHTGIDICCLAHTLSAECTGICYVRTHVRVASRVGTHHACVLLHELELLTRACVRAQVPLC